MFASGDYSVVSLIHTSAKDLLSKAMQDDAEGTAVRYALLNNAPIGVVGNIAEYTNLADSLAPENFSEEYLEDRINYVKGLMAVNLANSNGVSGTVPQADSGLYIDLANPAPNSCLAA